MRYRLGDHRVHAAGDHWIAPTAAVIGRVVLGHDVSIWWNAVLRADDDVITIGARSNIQDGCVLHVDPGAPLTIGHDVSVGHMAMLHGCTVEDEALIGIGSVILNGARIGRGALVAANTLIPEGKQIPPGAVVMGSPGKVVRQVDDGDRARMREGVDSYVARFRLYRDGLALDEDGGD